MSKSIKITLTSNNSEIIKQSDCCVTDNLGNLVKQIKIMQEDVNRILSNMVNNSSEDNKTCTDYDEDDEESENDDDENNDDKKYLNAKRDNNLKRFSEDKIDINKKVKCT